MVVCNKPLGRIDVNVIDDTRKGSIDIHIRPGPGPLAERPIGSIQAAQMVERSRVGGIVLKSPSYNTVSDAYLIKENLASGLHVFSSVVIGYTATGGLSHTSKTIEVMAKIRCKVVWFPVMDSKWYRSYLGREGGISIFKRDGILKDGVPDILELVKQYDMVVRSGRMSYEGSTEMFDAAIQKGTTKTVVIHPLAGLSRFTLDQIQELVAKGVYIEHVYEILMPRLGSMDPGDCVDRVKLVGADKCIMGTDLVQVWDTMPADGMRRFIATTIQFGCTPAEMEAMSKKNSAKLLGMEEGQEEQ